MGRWDTSQIADQTGRTFVITGANSGLGAVAAKALARAGGEVILACRNVEKGERVAAEIGERASVQQLDLADLASVRRFADELKAADARIDVLVNNAGVMAVPLRRTADGFEMQIGTNHLGHFALTGLLLDRITARVVTVSSGAHRAGKIDLADLNWERRNYQRWSAYGQSKLANLLFTRELQRRLAASGSPVVALAAHPGYAATDLQSHTETFLDTLMGLGNRVFAQSAEMGALPELYAATAANVRPGGYYGPTGFGGTRGYPGPSGMTAAAKDDATARGLWELSEKLTGVTYPV